jgi:hypothetical protein
MNRTIVGVIFHQNTNIEHLNDRHITLQFHVYACLKISIFELYITLEYKILTVQKHTSNIYVLPSSM